MSAILIYKIMTAREFYHHDFYLDIGSTTTVVFSGLIKLRDARKEMEDLTIIVQFLVPESVVRGECRLQ